MKVRPKYRSAAANALKLGAVDFDSVKIRTAHIVELLLIKFGVSRIFGAKKNLTAEATVADNHIRDGETVNGYIHFIRKPDTHVLDIEPGSKIRSCPLREWCRGRKAQIDFADMEHHLSVAYPEPRICHLEQNTTGIVSLAQIWRMPGTRHSHSDQAVTRSRGQFAHTLPPRQLRRFQDGFPLG